MNTNDSQLNEESKNNDFLIKKIHSEETFFPEVRNHKITKNSDVTKDKPHISSDTKSATFNKKLFDQLTMQNVKSFDMSTELRKNLINVFIFYVKLRFKVFDILEKY